jgi:hypothetical protein
MDNIPLMQRATSWWDIRPNGMEGTLALRTYINRRSSINL